MLFQMLVKYMDATKVTRSYFLFKFVVHKYTSALVVDIGQY